MVRQLLFLVPAMGAILLAAPAIAPADPQPPKKKITYADQVAGILNKHCVECHRPGEVAPFSLVGYENAKRWASMISLIAGQRKMPPWKAVPGHGEFRDENRLTDEQIATLKAWSDAGAPRGNPAAEPKPPVFPKGWRLGEPDLIVSADKPFELGAEGDDVYRNFVVKTDFKETRWVRAIDVKPGNTKVVHHVIAFLDENGRAVELQEKNKDGQPGYGSWGGGVGFMPNGSLGGWAPGVTAKATDDDAAFELKPGTSIVLQVHYHKSGKPETDQTRVGVYFSKKPPKKVLHLAWLANPLLRLRAGEKHNVVKLDMTVPEDVTIHGVMPHMHQLGRSMKASLELPDGTTKPLIFVDDWDFNWQLQYVYKNPVFVPKGSKVHIEAVYDNSADNPRNPNSPPKMVTWGEQTSDEMLLLVVAYTTKTNKAFDDRAALIKSLLRIGG
jgi:mono/diheme cytochrome c family protein